MQRPPPIEREAERLTSLASTGIDRVSEAAYNELVELAAFTAHTPMACITVIGEDEAWYKATIGFDAEGMDRTEAICAHTVATGAPLTVPDTRRDDRFRDNPLVTGDLGVRFYAGIPLMVDDDLAVGTLCVLDTRPRTFLSDDRRALQIIANQVTTHLHLARCRATN
ncbi:MAG: GAF domain-containing protein [Actinomycetota bacterium]